mgnify:CR=1 FL=1
MFVPTPSCLQEGARVRRQPAINVGRSQSASFPFAAFQEKELGSLEKGKQATFVIFENPVTADAGQVQNYAWRTFIKGKCVFKLEAL